MSQAPRPRTLPLPLTMNGPQQIFLDCRFNADCLAWRLRASSCLFEKKKPSPNDLAHLNLKYLDMSSIPFISYSSFHPRQQI